MCGVDEFYEVYCRPVDGSGGWLSRGKFMWSVTTSGPYFIYGPSHDNAYIYCCKKPCNKLAREWVRVDAPRLLQCDATVDALLGVDLYGGEFPL